MISRRAGVVISRRAYLQTVFLFIPNDDKHIFEGEKLTPEQNAAAVPDKEPVTNAIKYNHEIENPELIADLFIRASQKDILVTSLSPQSPIMGDKNIKWIAKEEPLMGTNLQFANITNIWFDKFNKEIKPLHEIPADSDMNITMKSINQYLEKAWGDQSITRDTLEAFYTSQKAFEKKQFNALELVRPDFNKISLFLIKKLTGTEDLQILLEYISSKTIHFSEEGSTEFITALIEHVKGSKEKLEIFSDYLQKSRVETDLSLEKLDALASVFIDGGNLAGARKVLAQIVKQSACPSMPNLELFFVEYDVQCADKSSDDVIRELAFLKPVLFHVKWTNVIFEFFLRHCVRNTVEFEHFIHLAGEEYVAKYQDELLQKLIDIGGDDKMILASQFIRRLNHISPATRDIAVRIFPKSRVLENIA